MSLIIIALLILCVVYFAFFRKSSDEEYDNAADFTPTESTSGTPDVVIVGGGVVGCTLAYSFAKDLKKKIVCIESDFSRPDKIIGELLQPGGYRKLKMLGLEDTIPKDCANVVGYTVFMDNEKVVLPYPDIYNEGAPQAKGFHYGDFIMNLRAKVKTQPNIEFIEGTVESFIEENGRVTGVKYSVKQGQQTVDKEAKAPLTILCNGAGSSLVKNVANFKPRIASCFAGVEMKGATEMIPAPWNGNVFMTKQGPVLCYPTSQSTVRCLIDFAADNVPKINTGDMAKYLKEVVAPEFPSPLREKFIETVDAGDIRVAQNRELPPERVSKKGVVVIGDAFNCRHPLTGGGMTVCFNDCVCLRNALRRVKDFSDVESVEKALSRFYKTRKTASATINVLANSLYSIFAARGDPMVPYMKQAVFEYFKIGGPCARGPVGLLAGLIESPTILVTHFFAVALVFCFKNSLPIPTPASIIKNIRLLFSATKIIGPFLVNERIMPYLFPACLFRKYKY